MPAAQLPQPTSERLELRRRVALEGHLRGCSVNCSAGRSTNRHGSEGGGVRVAAPQHRAKVVNALLRRWRHPRRGSRLEPRAIRIWMVARGQDLLLATRHHRGPREAALFVRVGRPRPFKPRTMRSEHRLGGVADAENNPGQQTHGSREVRPVALVQQQTQRAFTVEQTGKVVALQDDGRLHGRPPVVRHALQHIENRIVDVNIYGGQPADLA
mmetsp:Transcript_34225/g.98687  ORF Transcript_34225/g.98687 Transcript_34225/m.98687 type:complete len:213 (-) Transcript_34225:593-1231(-)